MATGKCFEAALLIKAELGPQVDAFICHGKPMGLRYWHAWVEYHDGRHWVVIDASRALATNGETPVIIIKRTNYYRIGQIDGDAVLRFDTMAAIDAMFKFDHAGPWSESADGAL